MEGKWEFPYYIVRFKHVPAPFSTDSRKNQFPYYIVRFKQNDCVIEYEMEKKFPYYIVRFKQKQAPYGDWCFSGFPYYIVRFKLDWLIIDLHETIEVSILHSTI